MQRHISLYLLSLVCLLMHVSCGTKPNYVLSQDEMVDVLSDLYLARSIYQNNRNEFGTEDKKNALELGVFNKYNISPADFDSSLVWYSDNIKLFMEINDSIASRLKAQSNMLTTEWDTYNNSVRKSHSILPASFHLNASNPTLSFDIDSLGLKTIKLESFELKFDIYGLSSADSVKAGIYFTYKDSVVKKIIWIDKNTHYVFEKPTLPDSLLQSISGYVHRLIRHDINILPPVIIGNITYQDSIVTTTTKPDSVTNKMLDKNLLGPRIDRPQTSDKKIIREIQQASDIKPIAK